MSFAAFVKAQYGWHAGAITGAIAGAVIVWAYNQDLIGWGWLCAASPLVVLGAVIGFMAQLGHEHLRAGRAS